jgi:hypothetical protein
MIIAFMGEYASGKDYLCQHLVDKYNAQRLSFSDEVRRLTQTIFPWMPFDFDPAVKDKPFIHPSNPHGLTPRDIWLLVGKVRDVNPKHFVEQFARFNYENLIEAYEKPDRLYIITDFRTADEWDFIQKYQIPVIKIEREDRTGLVPSAFEDFVRRFKEYDAIFTNNFNGTDEFDVFIKEFTNGKYARKVG